MSAVELVVAGADRMSQPRERAQKTSSVFLSAHCCVVSLITSMLHQISSISFFSHAALKAPPMMVMGIVVIVRVVQSDSLDVLGVAGLRQPDLPLHRRGAALALRRSWATLGGSS